MDGHLPDPGGATSPPRLLGPALEPEDEEQQLDCYPYTFSPLLLFAQSDYFDKGFSNYNSVAQFFSSALHDVDMLGNVLFERKNMLYEELLEHVLTHKMLVTCCIDEHFTAFQILANGSALYYDPLGSLKLATSGESCKKFVSFLLLKCNYGNNQHLTDNKDHYTGSDSNPTRRMIYALFRDINKMEGVESLYGLRLNQVALNLDRYLLINRAQNPRMMSAQLTGNTCYFQTYLFGVLCKVGAPSLARDGGISIQNVDKLVEATATISRFLLEFFVEEARAGEVGMADVVMRPLTNSNFVIDFYRYKEAPYFALFQHYLQNTLKRPVPDYEQQYRKVLGYFSATKTLHGYSKFTLTGAMSSTLNTKSLQPVYGTDDARHKLATNNYFKYRPANLMFGFNAGIMHQLSSFSEFNSLRKNQLLAFMEQIGPIVSGSLAGGVVATNKYRDYYFMPQFEVGQSELVDVHHYTYAIDMVSMANAASEAPDPALLARVQAVNHIMMEHVYVSTNQRTNYDKMMTKKEFMAARKLFNFFIAHFMSVEFHSSIVALGFAEINPREKDINSLTQSVFYDASFMGERSNRMEYEFEKECINEMARMTLRKQMSRFRAQQSLAQKYQVQVKIGLGYTYSKYNTLMHFVNAVQSYWQNPDLNSIQLFGKDIRAVLATSCQKIFFEEGHPGFYFYGPLEIPGSYNGQVDLAVAATVGDALPGVSREQRAPNQLVITDRVFEHGYLKRILSAMFAGAGGRRMKSDNQVLNLTLLSLMLDFGLFEEHGGLLNLPSMESLKHGNDTKALQVEVANVIFEFDKKSTADSVTRSKVEALIFETGYKFLVNKNFPVQSKQFELIRELNADPAYHPYVLLTKVYMSLCNINKSTEVDYYKVRCNGEYRIVIPENYSKSTSDYLDVTTKRYTFSERSGFICYADMPLFDLRFGQPHIDLFRVRFDSPTAVQSMVKYIEFANVFRAADSEQHYLMFIADNALVMEVSSTGSVAISINSIDVEVATIFFNEAISFVPCFKYSEAEDVIFFASKSIHYLVDQGGQFCTDYYGMKHELMECIVSHEAFVDLNDEHVFKDYKLSDLLTESKTVLYFPDFLLQVPNREQLINLLNLAIYVRNVSFFTLVLFYLRRSSVKLDYIGRDGKVTKIAGPWREAILYVLGSKANPHYERIFERQFFDLNQHEALPLPAFVEVLCENFTKYQRFADGQYQIVPTAKQKAFLQRIVCAEECFHFSEVGSGKTKVILPLLCQLFLSNNAAAHGHFARGGQAKDVLVILVPEHLVPDARTQVFRYCLNLNFRTEYRVYDDIFALLHNDVQLGRVVHGGQPMKQVFVTSFNSFKKALTYDAVCAKVGPHRERMLVVADEVDDFLDRDKLVFNICSNKGNSFDRATLERYFEVSRAAYRGAAACPALASEGAANPAYWQQLFGKFGAIHAEIQDASRSLNKSFGIFNEQTLRHCASNIAHDVEGYKSLIARPYESVNRAMPGSYYSDVERTVYLTFVVLNEDVEKYDELFQQERKFVSFEYWRAHLQPLDYDDLVYGHEKLSELVAKHPVATKDGLVRFLYEIILRRMEIRDKSRSVNSVDVVFNFDAIGFTGTPFIDNYPTFAYIRNAREDAIPDMIDRSFYAYSSDALPDAEFQARFAAFQGQNSHVLVEYVASDFVAQQQHDELAILVQIFDREKAAAQRSAAAAQGSDYAQLADARGSGGARGVQLALQQAGSASSVADVDSSSAPSPPPAPLAVVAGASSPAGATGTAAAAAPPFNVLVDLCGIFKRSSIHQVRDTIKAQQLDGDGATPHGFHFVYHIGAADGGDRVLAMHSDNDVVFDEEFFKHLCKTYGAQLRDRLFFFVDNRNVIGKDIPFQLVYQRRFGQPLFTKSVVLAHDVDDFSKIWQAMGRSRTMNDTQFAIYKSRVGVAAPDVDTPKGGESPVAAMRDIKSHALTRQLYVQNCDRKHAGNLSSVYQTLISLMNLAKRKFYHTDEIVNTFLEKLEMTIEGKVAKHAERLAQHVLGAPLPAKILAHLLESKFRRSTNAAVAAEPLTPALVNTLLRQVVQHKFEQRTPSGDVFDDLISFLSGEMGLMEISYTKQQQKQKQKQQNKNQDSDTMDVFDKKHQLPLSITTDNYFRYTLTPGTDLIKFYLNLPISVPVLTVAYTLNGSARTINVYPTFQFLYSHHIQPEYITQEVRDVVGSDSASFCARFMSTVSDIAKRPNAGAASAQLEPFLAVGSTVILIGLSMEKFNGRRGRVMVKETTRWGVLIEGSDARISVHAKNLSIVAADTPGGAGHSHQSAPDAGDGHAQLNIQVVANLVRQNPMYTLAALREGVYVLGMKEQFNTHDLQSHPMRDHVQYVADDAGFVLFDKNDAAPARGALDTFGPYFVEQYILMEVLSKQEVAHNVLDYYCHSKEKLQRGLDTYTETQGKGFICWRFLLREIEAAAAPLPPASVADSGDESDAANHGDGFAPAMGDAKRGRSGSKSATEADAEIDEIFAEAGL